MCAPPPPPPPPPPTHQRSFARPFGVERSLSPPEPSGGRPWEKRHSARGTPRAPASRSRERERARAHVCTRDVTYADTTYTAFENEKRQHCETCENTHVLRAHARARAQFDTTTYAISRYHFERTNMGSDVRSPLHAHAHRCTHAPRARFLACARRASPAAASQRRRAAS